MNADLSSRVHGLRLVQPIKILVLTDIRVVDDTADVVEEVLGREVASTIQLGVHPLEVDVVQPRWRRRRRRRLLLLNNAFHVIGSGSLHLFALLCDLDDTVGMLMDLNALLDLLLHRLWCWLRRLRVKVVLFLRLISASLLHR